MGKCGGVNNIVTSITIRDNYLISENAYSNIENRIVRIKLKNHIE